MPVRCRRHLPVQKEVALALHSHYLALPVNQHERASSRLKGECDPVRRYAHAAGLALGVGVHQSVQRASIGVEMVSACTSPS